MESYFIGGVRKLFFNSRPSRADDDFSDRFTHFITSILLVFFIIISSARQYIGQPIACWMPVEFSKAQEEFAESACWVSNTYTVLRHVYGVPENLSQREAAMIRYYQWMPFLLMIQVFLCLSPCIVWRFLHWQSPARLASIMEVACGLKVIDVTSCRETTVAYIARHIEEAVMSKQFKRNENKSSFTQHRLKWLKDIICCHEYASSGYYLLFSYLLCKILYVLNAMAQLYIMKYFFGTPHLFYGWDLLHSLFQGKHWQESGYFPRITMCDFEVKKFGNTHRHTIQCSLPMNMLTEKIFIFLWFWMVMVLIISFLSLLTWSCTTCCMGRQITFIKRFLQLRGCVPLYKSAAVLYDVRKSTKQKIPLTGGTPSYPYSELKKQLRSFVMVYLQQDGVFILRLISHNAGELLAAIIAAELWNNHCQRMNFQYLFPPIGFFENHYCPSEGSRIHSKHSQKGDKFVDNEFHCTPSTYCRPQLSPRVPLDLDCIDIRNKKPPVLNNQRVSGRASIMKRDDGDDVV